MVGLQALDTEMSRAVQFCTVLYFLNLQHLDRARNYWYPSGPILPSNLADHQVTGSGGPLFPKTFSAKPAIAQLVTCLSSMSCFAWSEGSVC